jgi:hypothetical protein
VKHERRDSFKDTVAELRGSDSDHGNDRKEHNNRHRTAEKICMGEVPGISQR